MRILCIDDDQERNSTEENKLQYCKIYGIDPSLVEFADTLDSACELIYKRVNEFDLVLLDIKIDIGESSSYKNYVKDIVTPEMLQKNASNYGGFYLYLMLLNQGFPNDRIGFLSGYIERNRHMDSGNSSKELMEFRELIIKKDDSIVEKLNKSEDSFVSKRQYNLLKDMINSKNYESALSILDGIINNSKDENYDILRNGANDSESEIAEKFHAFENSGIYIPEGRKFTKNKNKIYPGSENNTTPLLKWIDEKDPNGYYALRSGIIQGCKMIYEKIEKIQNDKYAEEEINKSIESLSNNPTIDEERRFRKLVREKHAEYMLNRLMKFYSYGNYHERYTRQFSIAVKNAGDISFEIEGNRKMDKYDIDYFKDMLISLENILPVREPEDENIKAQLFRSIIKTLTHPWEAGEANYKSFIICREDLFDSASSCIMKSLRNWTAHSRLMDFRIEDTAFLFIIAMHSFFRMDFSRVENFERTLFGIIKKTNDSIALKNPGLDTNLTLSLKSLNFVNHSDAADINIYNLFSSIGKRRDCKSEYIYRIFWHVMHSPLILFLGSKPIFKFNEKNNEWDNYDDIVNSIYSTTCNIAFGEFSK